MTSKVSYSVQNFNSDLEREIQRLYLQAQIMWKQESRNLFWFGLQDGMSVLELGSGPGFITEKLLSLLPKISITAIDTDPFMIDYCQQRLRNYIGNRLNISCCASIFNTGLPDNSFDFAIARLVFQHIPNPVDAAKEIRRVLKPGGKLVITDHDDEIFFIHEPPVPEYQIMSEKMRLAMATRNGNRRIGRQLWRILRDAGFQNQDLEIIVSHSDDQGLEIFTKVIDPELFKSVVKQGWATEQEMQNYLRAHDEFISSPEPLMLLAWLMASGEKP
ncbi:MAG: methyltransferase domain-containing protein [Symploca sp. SIO3C6]|uniref:Methyltransferase domain-containing protein n=1 Tax=Symploca sp. SIO1C4 TaxID=2607765 RepID=A0A6B3N7E4_9CYAN|nr:methyltransferase domain-containing protein [Symploca sp. SIO3C6]NER29039.1 methyltransferase domain-containing protein [Symploca sp. SIO1C4]